MRVGEIPWPGGGNFSDPPIWISHSGNFSSLRVREFLLPYMNFWFRGVSDSGNFSSHRVREFLFPPGPPGEAGMSPTLIWISNSGNFSVRNFWFREFLSYMNFWFREFLLPSMNFSPLRVREFIPIWISDSGNFSSLRGLQGRRECLLPYMNF